MKDVIKCISVFIVVTLTIRQVASIRCYSCRSDEVKDCETSPHQKYIVDCSNLRQGSNPKFCRKISQQLYFKGDDKVTTIRECASAMNDVCYKGLWSEDSYQLVCECAEDECNGAGGKHPPPQTTNSILFMAVLLHLVHRVLAALG